MNAEITQEEESPPGRLSGTAQGRRKAGQETPSEYLHSIVFYVTILNCTIYPRQLPPRNSLQNIRFQSQTLGNVYANCPKILGSEIFSWWLSFADRGVETMLEWNIPGPVFNGFLLRSPIIPVSAFNPKDAHGTIA